MAVTPVFFLEPHTGKKTRNNRQIELEQSHSRSHAARVSHQLRKKRPPFILHKLEERVQNNRESPCSESLCQTEFLGHPLPNVSRGFGRFICGTTTSEARSFAFFRERTAIEWSGWQDAEFWINFTTQVASTSAALRHALIGMAACHEAFEVVDDDDKKALREMSRDHGQKALRSLNEEFAVLPASTILTTFIALAAFAARLHPHAYASTIGLGIDFLNELKSTTSRKSSRMGQADEVYLQCYLEPIVDRQKSRCAHFTDLSWNLAQTPQECFRPIEKISIPTRFVSLRQVRDGLESILELATYEAKTRPTFCVRELSSRATALLQQWYLASQAFRDLSGSSERTRLALDILRVSARMNIMMIQTMDTEDEMIFDRYLDVFKQLAETFEQAIHLEKQSRKPAINFGADGCYMTLIGNAATRWCRDPSIRRWLIRLLHESRRMEGFETGEVWARVTEKLQAVEESGISPAPDSCHDIPPHHRVRLTRSLFYFELDMIQLRYVHPMSNTPDTEYVCNLLNEDQTSKYLAQNYATTDKQSKLQPDLDLTRDTFSWLDKHTNTYRSTKGSKFYFPLPRC